MKRFLLLTMIVFWGCASIPPLETPSLTPQKFELLDPPVIGHWQTKPIYLGGFSGLLYEGKDPVTGELLFLTHTNRGPNARPFKLSPNDNPRLPFYLPDFQLEWVRLAVNPVKTSIHIRDRIRLTQKDGKPLHGLPNLIGTPGMAYSDQTPVDADYKPLHPDLNSVNLEAIAKSPDGTYWMGEEYRPSLCHFDAKGHLIERFVPEGSRKGIEEAAQAAGWIEALPKVFAQRRMNRGFEAIAISGGFVYAFLQSPLDNPDTPSDENSLFSQVVRVLKFDMTNKQTVAEYALLLEDRFNDRKIGDALALPNGDFLIIEQTSEKGVAADKRLFRVSLSQASNLLQFKKAPAALYNKIESMHPEDFAKSPVKLADKKLILNLAERGYNYVEKAKGLALVDPHTLAIVSDNDFGVSESREKSTLVLVDLQDALGK